jgi:catalase
VSGGTLELTEVDATAETEGNIVVFDPMRLTDGIEPSDDPILHYRPGAYSVSAERRSA